MEILIFLAPERASHITRSTSLTKSPTLLFLWSLKSCYEISDFTYQMNLFAEFHLMILNFSRDLCISIFYDFLYFMEPESWFPYCYSISVLSFPVFFLDWWDLLTDEWCPDLWWEYCELHRFVRPLNDINEITRYIFKKIANNDDLSFCNIYKCLAP